jgi:hypothetical protein
MWAVLALIFVIFSLIHDFKGDIHNANNAMLWAIWSMLLSFYFKKEERE